MFKNSQSTINCIIRSVTAMHPKTASKQLKLITQSKVITQELKNREKASIFDIKSVTTFIVQYR